MRLPFLRPRADDDDLRWRLLCDLCGKTSTPPRRYRTLLHDRKAAEAEIDEDPDDLPPNWNLADAVFMHVGLASAALFLVDWAGGPDELLPEVAKRLSQLGAPVISAQDQDWITRYVVQNYKQRGDAMGLAYGPLAYSLQIRNLRMMLVQDVSDIYKFAISTPPVAEQWIGRRLSEGLAVECPSWTFDDELRGSRFAEFITPAPARGSSQDP